MQRFFVDPSRIDVIEGEEHLHLSKSLRLREGEEIELLDGARVFSAQIAKVEKERTLVRVLGEMPSREADVRLTLYIGALKGEKMDWVAQKCTELGVYAIFPVLMRRSVAQGVRVERLRRIAREAQKQCGRALSPRVEEPVAFGEALSAMRAHEAGFVAYEGGGEPPCDIGGAKDAALVIGPEGGIDEGEIEAMRDAGMRILTLGPRILRAETAAVAATAALMAQWGGWT